MLDMFVISGTDKFVCQSCGKQVLPLEYSDHLCKCGQVWRVDRCIGNPFSTMDLVSKGLSIQSGNPYYNSGWLVRAMK